MAAPSFYVEIRSPNTSVQQIQLEKSEYTIGRSRYDNDITLQDSLLSRKHLRLSRQDKATWRIIDLNSTNGILIDNVRIPSGQQAMWNANQTVTIGNTQLKLRVLNEVDNHHIDKDRYENPKLSHLSTTNSDSVPTYSQTTIVREYSEYSEDQSLDTNFATNDFAQIPPRTSAPKRQGYIGIDERDTSNGRYSSPNNENWLGLDEDPTEDFVPAPKPEPKPVENSLQTKRHAEFRIILRAPNQNPKTFVFKKDHVVIGGDKHECDIALRDLHLIGEKLVLRRDTSNTFTITNDSKHSSNPSNRTAVWPIDQLINIGNVTLQIKKSGLISSGWNGLIRVSKWGVAVTAFIGFLLLIWAGYLYQLSAIRTINILTIGISALFLVHGLFTLTWMIYGWNNLGDNSHQSPNKFEKPKFSFTALVPARHEEKVIKDTIKAINRINYPEDLKQILVLCRQDDTKTIAKVRETIDGIGQSNIRLITFNSYPINKPHSLNVGLRNASKDVITIFDAEDEPHKDLYHVVNTLMIREKADVVQSGVQLMNYRSHWFSILNVLEYFFWFRSGLHFFTKVGKVTPLGGNSVFFKKTYLKKVGGWDENCLTEDADIGIKLSLIGAKIHIVYDERHATQEETPNSVHSFVKQRTRWGQGFLQIFAKGDWFQLPQMRQRLVAGYILLTPLVQSLLVLTLPLGITIALTTKLSVIVAMISFIPLYILLFQFVTHLYGLYEFTRAYKLKFPLWMPVMLFISYYPYQIMLAVSAIRGLYRVTLGQNNWEKTAHTNAHRPAQSPVRTVTRSI